MKKEEILEKAIEKAIKNKWKPLGVLKGIGIAHCKMHKYYNQIIFSHDFAKAFWGKELLDLGYKDFKENSKYKWGFHLQQMVLEEDPIRYLEQFI